MVRSSHVVATVDGVEVTAIVQGFRPGPKHTEPYVFLGVVDPEKDSLATEVTFSTEAAHILSEEIRRHAEFAQTVREEGE